MVKLESLKTLSQVESIKDVKPLAKTVFPGAHCPLFGSALILKGVTDALMIVIGTDECTYYTKKFSLGYDSFGGMARTTRCYIWMRKEIVSRYPSNVSGTQTFRYIPSYYLCG